MNRVTDKVTVTTFTIPLKLISETLTFKKKIM